MSGIIGNERCNNRRGFPFRQIKEQRPRNNGEAALFEKSDRAAITATTATAASRISRNLSLKKSTKRAVLFASIFIIGGGVIRWTFREASPSSLSATSSASRAANVYDNYGLVDDQADGDDDRNSERDNKTSSPSSEGVSPAAFNLSSSSSASTNYHSTTVGVSDHGSNDAIADGRNESIAASGEGGHVDRQNNNSPSLPTPPFFHEHCELSPEDDDWRDPTPRWRQRTPRFLLIGAKKAGTTTLHHWLAQHPRIYGASRKELLYFLPERFDRASPVSGKVQVKRAREDLIGEFKRARLNRKFRNGPGGGVAFEATPGYLLYSTRSRVPIFCALPWIRLLVSLREPVDRTHSHYNFLLDLQLERLERNKKQQQQQQALLEKGGSNETRAPSAFSPTPSNETAQNHLMVRNRPCSFEDAIRRDVSQLKRAGVLQSEIPAREFAGSVEERLAWTRYQNLPHRADRLVGRSLYVLQLQEWYDSMERDLGRDPRTEILVVRSEDMKAAPGEVYDRIIDWLRLPPQDEAAWEPSFDKKLVTKYRTGALSNTTRHMLRELYEPYNKRLYELLGWNNSTSANRVWS